MIEEELTLIVEIYLVVNAVQQHMISFVSDFNILDVAKHNLIILFEDGLALYTKHILSTISNVVLGKDQHVEHLGLFIDES